MSTPNYYSIIPASVRYDKNISSLAKLLYSEITALSNTLGYCSAGNAYFAKLYAKTEQWVSATINDLEKKGHITIEVNQEKGNSRKIWIKQPKKKRKPKSSEPTPRNQAEAFFNDKQAFLAKAKAIAEAYKVDEGRVVKELMNFHIYWSEKDPNGKKQKWQMRETFELDRRIMTWLKNVNKYNAPKNKKIFGVGSAIKN